MTRITGRQAWWLAGILLVLVLVLGFLFPQLPVLETGLALVVLVTIFIPGLNITVITGILAALIVTWSPHRQPASLLSLDPLSIRLFSLILITFATVLAAYFKKQQHRAGFERKHMTSLFENATEGIVLTNGRGEIVLVNPAAESMFGYTAGDLVGGMVEKLLPQRIKDKHVNLRENYYDHPQNRAMGSGRDLYARRKDDSEFPVEVSLSHYKQQNETYVIAFIVDISFRKKAEENMIRQQRELEKVTNDIRKLNTQLEIKVEERTQILKEALTRLEKSQIELKEALDKERQLNEIKSRFVSMASHEFRTPLSSVLSSATLLGKYVQSEEQEKRNKHINRIRDSVKHLNQILEDFLSLGRLDENKEVINFGDFDLQELIRETAEELKAVLKKDQQIRVGFSGERVVCSDKRLIKNILINLAGNASKFSGEGKEIWIRASVEPGWIDVNVSDQGIGIPEDDQEHLFSSFFRASNATNIQGTGLGLHIVKRYAGLLQGNVHLKSRLGEGTTIRVHVPQQPVIPGEEKSGEKNNLL